METSAITEATVSVLPPASNRPLTVSMAPLAWFVSSRLRKSMTAFSTLLALALPMTCSSSPSTAAKTSRVGNKVSTAMNAFSEARPRIRSRSPLRHTSATSRPNCRIAPCGCGRAASAAVAFARATELRRSSGMAAVTSCIVSREVVGAVTPPARPSPQLSP